MLTSGQLPTKNFKLLNTTGQRVRALREKLGITQTELSRRMGFSRNYISLIENGREPKRRFLKELELLEQAPIPYIEHSSIVQDGPYAAAPRHWTGETALTTQVIPLLTWAEAGTTQAWADVAESEGFVGFNVRDAKAVAVQIRGDTMAPAFPQGTVAIVYPGWEAKSGDLVIARLNDGTVMFKRLHVDGNRYTFISLNPMYPPVTVKKAEVERLLAVGGTYQSHL